MIRVAREICGCKLPLELAERRGQLKCANNSSLTPDTRDEVNE
jgi:hypothetical protein